MALVQKGYVGDSKVHINSPSTVVSNGTVYSGVNPTAVGYPSSIGSYGGSTSGGNGSFGSWYNSKTASPSNGSFGSWYTSKTASNQAKSGGSGAGGSSGSSSAASSGTNTADAYNALLAAYKQNDYSDYLRQMREAAQAAYDRGMGALNSAYDQQMNSLSNNLNETKNMLTNQYNRSRNDITTDAESSLRQAYINNMMNRKNLGQQMSAQGLTGGATETTIANMLNNYGNARNNINTTQNRNLANLEGNYNDNLSQAMQAYNSAVATANLQKAQQQMSLENALANNQISALGDYQTLMQRENQNYLDLLKAAIQNGASFSYDPTRANNAYNAISLQQAANPNLVNNLAAIEELMGQNTAGVSTPGVTVLNQAANTDVLNDWINYINAVNRR